MPNALDNLRVVDFSLVLVGPFATMMLGDLGADVTKIERPGGGDDTRAWDPPYDDASDATYFQAVSCNKDSVVLDLADSIDWQLAAEADVLVEHFHPGIMERLGLGYESLRRLHPGLINWSITGFGRAAGAGSAGDDPLIRAVGGLMSITGDPRGQPRKVGVALRPSTRGLRHDHRGAYVRRRCGRYRCRGCLCYCVTRGLSARPGRTRTGTDVNWGIAGGEPPCDRRRQCLRWDAVCTRQSGRAHGSPSPRRCVAVSHSAYLLEPTN